VRAFEQAYRMKPAASLLFNIARAYDRLFIVDNEAIERLEALTFIQAKRKPTPAPTPPPAVQYPTCGADDCTWRLQGKPVKRPTSK
jgi:hypothetical protein